MPNDKSPPEPETAAQQQTGGDCVSRIVRLSDVYWKPWLAALLELAALHGITTSDDADLWWDDFGAGKTPQESMDGFLTSDEGAQFRDSLPNAIGEADAFAKIEKLERERDEARREAIRWQDAWMNETTLQEMGSTLMPWMHGWKKSQENDKDLARRALDSE